MESQERFLHSRVSFSSDYDHSAYWLVYDSLIPRFDFGSIFLHTFQWRSMEGVRGTRFSPILGKKVLEGRNAGQGKDPPSLLQGLDPPLPFPGCPSSVIIL